MKKFISSFCLSATLALSVAAQAGVTPQAGTLPQAGTDASAHCPEHDGHHRHGGQHRGHHGDRHGGPRGDKHGWQAHDDKPFFLRGLALSPEQDGKVQALLRDQQPALQAKQEAAHKARQELRALTFSGRFDDKQARRLAQSAATAQAEASLQRARTQAQVLQLLTPEQRQQLAQKRQEREARHAERMRGKTPAKAE